jgi:hypothetical protein
MAQLIWPFKDRRYAGSIAILCGKDEQKELDVWSWFRLKFLQRFVAEGLHLHKKTINNYMIGFKP